MTLTPAAITPIALLFASNVFMTTAWYGTSGLPIAPCGW